MQEKLWISVAILLSAVLGFTWVQAAEPLDFTSCASGTVPIRFWKTEGMTINIIDHMGINRSNNDNKLFDNSTLRCTGITRNLPNNGQVGNGYCKYKSPQGDTSVLEWTARERGSGTWNFLEGTGNWKGITGSGDYKRAARGKPIEEGTYQICIRVTGTVELPK